MRVQERVRLLNPGRLARLWSSEPLRRKERQWPGKHRPKLLARGFLSEAGSVYDFDRYGYSQYVSDSARARKSWNINPARLQGAAKNKLFFHDRLAAEGLDEHKPRLLGVFANGGFHSAGHGPATLGELLDGGEDFVVKRLTGDGARDLRVVRHTSEGLVCNDSPVSRDKLAHLLCTGPDSVVEEHLDQHAYASALYPYTTNTLRVQMMQDPATGEPFVAMVVHRIGTDVSRPADNWERGGLSAEVELGSGLLGPAARFPKPDPVQWHETHPDVGAQIKGVRVPWWEEALQLADTLARRLSFLPYVGFDLLVTENGPKVIEANQVTGLQLLQVHRPLLADERVRRFYRHHGLV